MRAALDDTKRNGNNKLSLTCRDAPASGGVGARGANVIIVIIAIKRRVAPTVNYRWVGSLFPERSRRFAARRANLPPCSALSIPHGDAGADRRLSFSRARSATL